MRRGSGSSFASFLQKIWWRPRGWHSFCALFLLPLSLVYFLSYCVARAVGYCQRCCQRNSVLPILIVGNIVVGGCGKTPIVLHICRLLQSLGFFPGIISRGYGGDTSQALLVKSHHTIQDVQRYGDEPCLLATHGFPVVVGSNRLMCVQQLRNHCPAVNVIVSDDGLQHWRLWGVRLCVLGARGFGNGHLLPAGPLREPRWRLHSMDACLAHAQQHVQCPAAIPCFDIIFSLAEPRLVLDPECTVPWEALPEKVRIVTGISNPYFFFDMVKQKISDVECFIFPDHHFFLANDFERFDDGMTLLMTEKDYTKCRFFAQAHWLFVPLDVTAPKCFPQFLMERVNGSKNARDSCLPRL